MKTFARVLLSGLFASSFAFTACGDDKDDPKTETVQEVTPETVAETTPETVAETTPETVEETTPGPTNQCTNADDGAKLQGGADASGKAASCGRNTCIGSLADKDAFEECVQTCMLNDTVPNFTFALSDGCSRCFSATIRCTSEFCLTQCLSPDTQAACDTCRADNGCVDDFYDCSGLPRN